jgi:hypothetical protein
MLHDGFMSRGCDGEDPEFVTRLIEWNAIIDAM